MFTMPEWMATGDHASRPAAGDVVDGALYSCTDHSLIYQSDGTSWSTWATLGSAGGAPDSADYLVGTANGSLSGEIVVGTTPGGELGGTWGSPTVDATHSGSAHTDFIAKAIVDAKGDLIAATAADTVARLAVAANGSVLRAASGQSTGLEWQLNNLAASVAPTVNEDSGDGYSVGSRWIDTTADKEYVCLDATAGAAVWTETTSGSGGSGTLTTVKDEGSNLSTAVVSMDFVGAGVTATGTTAVTVTIPGGGTVSHSYAGYNTIGGSSENVSNRIFLKKITLASAGVIVSVGVYIKQVTAGTVMDLACGLLDDVAGTPTHLIAFSAPSNDNVFLSTTNGAAGDARWIHMPLGFYAAAGDYWLAINTDGGGSSYNIYFDGSGSDQTYVPTTDRMSDAGWTTVTTTSNKYSIRASVLG